MSTAAQTMGQLQGRRPWIAPVLLLGGLIVALYAPVLSRLVAQWWSDPEWGHGFLVPAFVAYLLYERRQALRQVRWAPANAGLLLMLGGVALLLVGALGAELFLSRASLLVLLAGLVVYLAGWPMLRAVAFPLAFLGFMIPLPRIVYNQVTFPLQLLASRLASTCLNVGIPVLQEGNIIVLPNASLEVVEACSGVRSLLSLLVLAVALGHLLGSRLWVRLAVGALTVPIAVATNALRVVFTGILVHQFGPKALEGFLHSLSGWLVFVCALALLIATHSLLHRLAGRKEAARA